MSKREMTQATKKWELKTSGGIATWKLVVMVLVVVVLGALGAYSLEMRKTGATAPGIDFGFNSAATTETTAQGTAL